MKARVFGSRSIGIMILLATLILSACSGAQSTPTAAPPQNAQPANPAPTLAPAPTPAPAPSPAAPNEAAKGADAQTQNWEEVVSKAKQEGKLFLGGPPVPVVRDFIMEKFQQAYPEIKVEFTAAVLPNFPARVEAERAAGKYLWDVYFWGPGPEVYRLANNGALDPLGPSMILPEVNNPEVWGGWDIAYLDKGKKYVFSFWDELSMIQVNADVIPPGTITKLTDLLDPKYKGKIVWWDPRSGGSGSNYAAAIYDRLGEEGFKQLFVDQEPLLVPNNTDVAERMVRKTHPIGLGSGDDVLKPFIDSGMKLDIRPLGRSPDFAYAAVGYGTVAKFNQAPNENAAKVFINWLLSKDVQIELAALTNRNSRRTDVPVTNEEKKPIPGERYNYPQSEDSIEFKSKVIEISKTLRP